MLETNRTEWQIRCAFNGFCKRTLKNEAIYLHKQTRKHQLHEIAFSDLMPSDKKQLYCYDIYFEDENTDVVSVSGKKISHQMIHKALQSLPEDKRKAVVLRYFFNKSDTEISSLIDTPRGTLYYQRKTSFEYLRRYLEENINE